MPGLAALSSRYCDIIGVAPLDRRAGRSCSRRDENCSGCASCAISIPARIAAVLVYPAVGLHCFRDPVHTHVSHPSTYTLAGHGEQAAHGLFAKVLTLWRAMVSRPRMAFSPKCLHFGGPW